MNLEKKKKSTTGDQFVPWHELKFDEQSQNMARFGRSFAEIAEPGKKGQTLTVAREECNKYDFTV
jgi:hypothetical protein